MLKKFGPIPDDAELLRWKAQHDLEDAARMAKDQEDARVREEIRNRLAQDNALRSGILAKLSPEEIAHLTRKGF